MWPPVCSQDVRELREDEAADERRQQAAQLVHDQFCVDGWTGEDAHGRPVACRLCHPGLERRLAVARGGVA